MSQLKKRFWKDVTLQQVRHKEYAPMLDGRLIKLPKGGVLAVPSSHLAQALAEEWKSIATGEVFSPDMLPLTRITGTLIERVRPHQNETRAVLFEFGLDDALCYRTAAQDELLVGRVLAWANEQGLKPDATTGIMPLNHSAVYKQKLMHFLATLDAYTLAALGVLTPVFSSLLLSLALVHNVLNIKEAIALGQADEAHQLQKWGHDDEFSQQLEQRARDVQDAMRFLTLAQQT